MKVPAGKQVELPNFPAEHRYEETHLPSQAGAMAVTSPSGGHDGKGNRVVTPQSPTRSGGDMRANIGASPGGA